jgi:hypothetical protein
MATHPSRDDCGESLHGVRQAKSHSSLPVGLTWMEAIQREGARSRFAQTWIELTHINSCVMRSIERGVLLRKQNREQLQSRVIRSASW